ncbi:unnamed protein product, partial [marine sediment metagenome]
MGQISIGKPIDTSLIRCCSCHKGYDIKGNIYKNKILICPHCGLAHKIDFTLIDKKIKNLKKLNKLNLTTYTSQYPPAQSDDHVKATTKLDTDTWAYFATDPAKSLTGAYIQTSWISTPGGNTNQRFHIDLGSGKVIRRIY